MLNLMCDIIHVRHDRSRVICVGSIRLKQARVLGFEGLTSISVASGENDFGFRLTGILELFVVRGSSSQVCRCG